MRELSKQGSIKNLVSSCYIPENGFGICFFLYKLTKNESTYIFIIWFQSHRLLLHYFMLKKLYLLREFCISYQYIRLLILLVTLKTYLLLKPITTLQKHLFPSIIIEWNKLDPNIRSYPYLKLFRKWILEFIRPHRNGICDVPNSLGLTYLISLRVGLSYLREYALHHNFWDSLNSVCNYDHVTEPTKLPIHKWGRVNTLITLWRQYLNHGRIKYIHGLTNSTNTFLLNFIIECITSVKRFGNPLIL